MHEILIYIQIAAIITILFSLIYMFRGDSTYIHKLMLTFMVAELVQCAGYLLELQATTLQEAMLAVKVEYMGGSIVAIIFMMFIRCYCGSKQYVTLERILLLCGCATIVMVWTSSSNQFYYTNVEFLYTGAYPHLKLSYGLGFYFYLVTCTVIPWAISVFTLLSSIRKEKSFRRKAKLKYVTFGTFFALIILLL